MSERLYMIAPELVRLLQRTERKQLRAVRAAICDAAIRRASLDDPVILEALGVLNGSDAASATLRCVAAARVEQLDSDYFDLQDAANDGRATQDEVRHAFNRARAAAAVSFAISGEGADITCETVYEAAATADDFAEIDDLVDAVLYQSNDA